MTHHYPRQVLPADTDSIELPLQTRMDVRLMPDTVLAEARTIEVVWSTGAGVRRRDPWTGKAFEEVLSLDPAHVDLTRLNGGAPLLNAHGAFDLEDVIGVVERAWIAREGGSFVGRAIVRFSDRAEVEPIWQDVKGGIIRNVSVGYTAGGAALTVSWTRSGGTCTFTCDPVAWLASGAGIAARVAVVHAALSVSDKPLVGYLLLDSGNADVAVTAGNTLSITQHPSGLFTLS